MDSAHLTVRNFGQLKKAGYKPKSISEELRENLRLKLLNTENVFEGIIGYDDTVIPDLERAILSGHNINLLGLRGQAKTRMARQMIRLLDEYIPVVEGSELNDDPFSPVSHYARELLERLGDETPVSWLHREERFAEKLATPDVSVADLIGDIDPIKAANLKLSLSDERVIHYGLIPRSNRCIFVINELPDLQARIQVALFNILQEGDIQIRGFRLRLPLDIRFVFTANPEDYTNRGSIVTPLKDRIGSQILTHYPKNIAIAREITRQETIAKINPAIEVSEVLENIIEQIGFEARNNEFVDGRSGVSARLSITARENLSSTAERRMLLNGEKSARARISDLHGVIPAITGKIELVYEGEQEGAGIVAQNLLSKAISYIFTLYFPKPNTAKKESKPSANNPYAGIEEWFSAGNSTDLLYDLPEQEYRKELDKVKDLASLVKQQQAGLKEEEHYLMMELVLHGLAGFSKLSRKNLEKGYVFRDLFDSMFTLNQEDEEDEDFENGRQY